MELSNGDLMPVPVPNPLLMQHKWQKATMMPVALGWPPPAGKKHIPIPQSTQKEILLTKTTKAPCESKATPLNALFEQRQVEHRDIPGVYRWQLTKGKTFSTFWFFLLFKLKDHLSQVYCLRIYTLQLHIKCFLVSFLSSIELFVA